MLIAEARAPGPIVVVINPAAVVIRRPTPWLLSHPGPAVWRAPRPVPVAIRRPVVVVVDYGNLRPPDPAIIVGVNPITISIQFFRAPDIGIVIPNAVIVSQASGQLCFATGYPIVPAVFRRRISKVPIAFVAGYRFQRRTMPIAHDKARTFRVDAGTTVLAHCYLHAAVLLDIDAIKAFCLRRNGCLRRINFKVFVITIKPP